MIELTDLRFRWPGAAHDCLAIDRLHIAAGRRVFLHGPSGSGKSTLLGLLAGVLSADAGRIDLLGRDWRSMSGAQRDAFRADHVGYVFQQFNLLPYLGVLDNVLLPCRFSARRRARAEAEAGSLRAAAEALLAQVGLDPSLGSRPASSLSVGQQQRVAAARALIGRPELVIADEPTSALDAELRDGFMALLMAPPPSSRTAPDTPATLVFVSHDERLASGFDERVSLREINRVAQEVV